MTTVQRLGFAAALFTLPLACGGRPALDTPAATPPSSTTGASGAGSSPGSASGASTVTAPDAGAESPPPVSGSPPPPPASTCAATCATPFAGAALATPAEVAAALVGRWQICAGADEWRNDAPVDTVGIEFTPPDGPGAGVAAGPSGDFYYLVAGPDGTPARGADDAHHLRYTVVTTAQVDLTNAAGGSFWVAPTASSCPRQLQLRIFYSGELTLHVPLADGDRPPSLAPHPCTSTTATAPAMAAETFCQIYVADCGQMGRKHYWYFDDCLTSYAASDASRQVCQSYHLCNADHLTGAARDLHCDHAAGLSLCGI